MSVKEAANGRLEENTASAMLLISRNPNENERLPYSI